MCAFSDGSCWEIIIIKQIHTFTSNILFEQRREQSYIGETGCTACVRVNEHASYVKNGRFDMFAAAEHAIFEQHALDFDNVEVIDCERHEESRKRCTSTQKSRSLYEQRQRIGTETNLVQPLSLTPFVVF